MKNVNSVVHFEMPFDDGKRMENFYQKAFGWKTQAFGVDMGQYILATTTEGDEKGHPLNLGAINGGFYPKKPDMPAQYPSLVIAVTNIKDSMKNITDAGGKVLGEPVEIPGYGMYVSFLDTEGNRVSLMEPSAGM